MNLVILLQGPSTTKRFRHPFLLLLFVVLLTFFWTGDLSASGPLTINTPGEPPYHYPDQTGIIDLWVKEAFSRVGHKVSVDWQPPERGLENANRGIVDGDAGRIGGLTGRYSNLIAVPEKLMVADFLAFTMNSGFRAAGWDSLKPYNVAIVRGHKISEENVVGVKSLFKVRDAESLFSLLNNRRVDVVVCERLFGSLTARKINPQIVAVAPPLAHAAFYLYLHKKHELLVPKISTALMTMKRDGTYRQIQVDVQRRIFNAQ